MAAEYDGGVIIGADTRTSTGYVEKQIDISEYRYFNYFQFNLTHNHFSTFVANRFTDKLTPLADRIFCLRSGSAADTQTIAQIVTYQLDFLS